MHMADAGGSGNDVGVAHVTKVGKYQEAANAESVSALAAVYAAFAQLLFLC
jgi:hypothetical protein